MTLVWRESAISTAVGPRRCSKGRGILGCHCYQGGGAFIVSRGTRTSLISWRLLLVSSDQKEEQESCAAHHKSFAHILITSLLRIFRFILLLLYSALFNVLPNL